MSIQDASLGTNNVCMLKIIIVVLTSRLSRASALRALGLLLADSAFTVGRGQLFDASANFFFYENGHNLGTRSRKIAPKVENEWFSSAKKGP